MGNTDIILVLKSGRTTRRISSSEIRFIHCDHPICDLHLADGKVFTCTKTLRYFEETLPKDSFCRISNNTIVNLNAVEEAVSLGGHRHNVQLKSGETLSISYRKWKNFKESFK